MLNSDLQVIRAVILDDELSARNVLTRILERYCPEVEIIGQFADVLTAVAALAELKPDVVFLDVHMPQYAGYELLNFFDAPDFEIIFVTAYDRYALKAFEVSALDYLLKPIEIPRLQQALSKLQNRLSMRDRVERLQHLKEQLQEPDIQSLIVLDKGYQQKIKLEDIFCFEAQEAYTTVYAKDGKYTLSRNIKYYEELLQDASQFFRCHKSWLINLQHIQRYSRSLLEIVLQGGLTAKLSKYRKAEFERVFEG